TSKPAERMWWHQADQRHLRRLTDAPTCPHPALPRSASLLRGGDATSTATGQTDLQSPFPNSLFRVRFPCSCSAFPTLYSHSLLHSNLREPSRALRCLRESLLSRKTATSSSRDARRTACASPRAIGSRRRLRLGS